MDQMGLPFGDEREAPAGAAARRVFLGWDGPALERAAAWLLEDGGDDQRERLVVLPGSRAVRRLRELLARRAPADWQPPRVLTQGELSDELVRLTRPAADRLTRTLVWVQALDGLPAKARARIALEERADPRSRRRLAETIRTLHAELAREGKSFADLARGDARPELDVEAERWVALARVQRSYREQLHDLELEDPHEGRWHAIEQGRIDRSREVVLVGVAELDLLTARLVSQLGERLTVLVVAPETEAAAFDELGRLRVEVWKERDVALPIDRWRVCEKPVDQADAVERELAAWSAAAGGLACDAVTVGVADEEVVPFLERRLLSAGARARHASGTPLTRTRPYRLLTAVARYVTRGGYAELAALARDPDVERALGQESDAAYRLDAYHVEHLPRSGRGEWVDDPQRTPAIEALERRVAQLLGPLAARQRRQLGAWPAAVRALLERVYPDDLDPDVERDRLLALALRELGRGLDDLAAVPEPVAREPLAAGEALELLASEVASRMLPPAPARPGETVVELLGWLELPLDDAPYLAVTGFNEGHVPASRSGDAFLPDGARRRLQLPADEERLARDAYAATVLLASRRGVVFVTGRRNGVGDPLVPSRLAFHRPAAEVPAAVQAFLPATEEERVATALGDFAARDDACPRVDDVPPITRMSVSSFRTYLESPYAFLLKYVLRLESVTDDERELSALAFGNLAHAALEAFGTSALRDSTDEKAIADFLSKRVDALVRERFGAEPLPAVLLQREQLRYRLGIFAREQVAWRRSGWSIRHVEWEPPAEAAMLEVDGEPLELRGRIDRIDVNEDGRWAVLDYKTGEKVRDPEKAHRKRGKRWVDLQLPLYRHLTRTLGLAGEPTLGYVNLGKDDDSIAFALATWDADELDGALAVAEDVVRKVRKGELWERGERLPYGDVFQAIWGVGRVGVTSEGGDAEVEA